MNARPQQNQAVLGDQDLYLWNEGSHYRLFDKLGSHPIPGGASFAVWAPNARAVSVVGDWNGWDPEANPLQARGASGIWEGTVSGAEEADAYKYRVVGEGGVAVDKADPFGFHHETPPRTASKIWDLSYDWGDAEWMESRAAINALDSPISVYEVHLGSWRRGEGGRHLTYRELAEQLPSYVRSLGFTHVEILPVMEHPFYGSWGYQTTGYFAPTSRYGTPQDFMYLVDSLHQAGIGVILDWVPSHFPGDEHGLARFDGTHLYEHADPKQGFHPDWTSYVFNYGRNEVPSFLISSAIFWLEKYHADGLRVDAVASMLYLDYSRKAGEWVPNVHGGRENLEAIAFLRRLNEKVYAEFPDTQTYAEESTSWPMVSRPVFVGGLGFGLKWDLGWMHDILRYLGRGPVYRSFHHNELTFRGMYAFSENFILPLSHDEVVHGKGSLLGKMPGDEWQRFANLRVLLAFLFTTAGKKLLFMGAEIGQPGEWSHESAVPFGLTAEPAHAGISRLVGDLNRLYREMAALHDLDNESAGFEWAVANDSSNSVLAYFRRSRDERWALVVHNMTPIPRHGYRIGVPLPGQWEEVFNSDSEIYGGSGQGNFGGVDAMEEGQSHHGRPWSVEVTVPPLASVIFEPAAGGPGLKRADT